MSETDISKIIMGIKSKAYGFDGINITLSKYACPYILPYITPVINTCLESSVFPSQWKQGKITSLPKTDAPKEVKELRPITILQALSKVLERAMEMQLQLLNTTDDIISALDNRRFGVLVLLDFTKAFDMINHELFLAIAHYIGLDESDIIMFRNYLKGRTHTRELYEKKQR